MRVFPDARRILILCGPGNNGGDGFAAARHLHNGGLDVQLCLLGDPAKLSPDAATNHRLAEAFGVPMAVIEDDDLSLVEALLDDRPTDLVVDALLGTGTDRPLAGRYAALVELVAASGLPVVAVDVPTGLNGSSSEIPGPHLPADLTVTFASLKICHVLPPACIGCGEVAVVDIGIPPAALEAGSLVVDDRGRGHLADASDPESGRPQGPIRSPPHRCRFPGPRRRGGHGRQIGGGRRLRSRHHGGPRTGGPGGRRRLSRSHDPHHEVR